jgi:hypothetical protein
MVNAPTAAARAPAHDRAATPRWLFVALAALAVLGVCAAIGVVDYIPTNDGPQHVILGHIENRLDDPASGFGAYFVRGRPLTSLGFHAIYTVAERWMPWRAALRVCLVIITLLWSLGYLAFVRAVDRRRAPLALLGFATAFQWHFYLGFMQFLMSLGLGFPVLAVAVSGAWTVRRRLLLALMLAAQAVAHVFGATLTTAVVLALALFRAKRKTLALDAVLAALMAAPAVALTVVTARASGAPPMPTVWLEPLDKLAMLAKGFVGGPAWRSWPFVVLALAGFASAAMRARRGVATDVEKALAVAGGGFFLLGALAPLHYGGLQVFGPRFLPLSTMLGVALVPVERLRGRAASLALVASAALTAASLVWAGAHHVALRRRVDDALSGLDQPIRRSGPRLPIVLDPWAGLPHQVSDSDLPLVAPLFNLGKLYAVQQGGVPPYLFTTASGIHFFLNRASSQRAYPPAYNEGDLADPELVATPEARARFLGFLAMLGAGYEDVILYGEPRDAAAFTGRGYQADWQRGGLLIAHFTGCPLAIAARAPARPPAPLLVEVRWGRELPPALMTAVMPDAFSPSGEARVECPHCPCGELWFRAGVDLDGSHGPSRADAFCAGADAVGMTRATATPETRVLDCTLP